jgi:hypothetical protein
LACSRQLRIEVAENEGGLNRFGNIDQRTLGRSIAAEIAFYSQEAGEVIRENAAMKKLAAQFNSVAL